MKKGTKLIYTGKGFVDYDPQYKEMEFISEEENDYWVYYENSTDRYKMLVRNTEVIKP
jgi:hypothetical protein